MNTAIKTTVIIITLLLAVVIGWGVAGGMEAQDPGVTCDMGLGENLCWQWHTNTVGQIDRFIDDVMNEE